VEVTAGKSIPCASIKVHFKGYTSQYDIWIDCVRETPRISEIGSFSGAEGHAKHS
jgi:hypothetical protein